MHENTFKHIDNVFRRSMGSESDYVEQASWMLFLRYIDAMEEQNRSRAILNGEEYTPVLADGYRWSDWAFKTDAEGKAQRVLGGADLLSFVKDKLFPYLRSFRNGSHAVDTIQYRIGGIFEGLENKVSSGYDLSEVLEKLHALSFGTEKERYELNELYENRLKNMSNAGRTQGQYYTPRPIIRAMIHVLDPKVGETIYDPACGSAGFLCEAYDYVRERMVETTDNLDCLNKKMLIGKEKLALPYMLGTMNMILHGIEAPNISRTNTLNEDVMDIDAASRVDVVLANPPFGGEESPTIQHNFEIKTSETAIMFMEHFVAMMKPGGRAAVVIKNTVLSNSDGADIQLREMLLKKCNLHTILILPDKAFQSTGAKTVVLYFTKNDGSGQGGTDSIWFYDLQPGRSLGKKNPLNDNDLKEFLAFQKERKESEKSWTLNMDDVDDKTWDLSPKNPNAPEQEKLREPLVILEEMRALDAENKDLFASIEKLLS